MYRKIFIVLFLFLSVTLHAQEVYFCQSHTEQGNPIGAANTWSINANGGYIFILLKDKKVLTDQMYYLFIDKKVGSETEPFDSKVIRHNGEDNFIVYNYVFKEAGIFEVYFMDSEQKVIAKGKVTIQINEQEKINKRDFSGLYYDNSRIVACERVIGEKPLNIKYKTSLKVNRGLMYIYVENDRPLDTKKVLVDIWKKKNSLYEYDEWVASKKFKTEPTWKYTFFKYQFLEVGEYKISIYNDKQVLIGSTYIKVGG
ncbi:MAG: hypothetical protein JEY94_07540 [Melioribacteraceae bacterium]|nr:hypothetical protein [Melioribacteraceae bacterium]